MADHCAIYGRLRAPLSLTVLEGVAPGANVVLRPSEASSGWAQAEVRWPDAALVLTSTGVGDATFEKHLAGFLARTGARLTTARHGPALLEALSRSRSVVGVTATAGFDPEGRCREVVYQLAAHLQGVISQGDALLDPRGRALLSPSGGLDADAQLPRSPSAEARRARSIERLRRLGLALPHGVGLLEGDEESWLREPKEVACRAEALFAVAARAEGLPAEGARALLEAPGLWSFATPAEQAYLVDPAPDPRESLERAWSYEGLWILLWALGRVEVLHSPTAVCDVPRAAGLMTEVSPTAMVGQAQLRPQGELLEEADFTHCATAAAKAQAQSPLQVDVLLERRRAFRWLTRHWNQSWDQVALG